MKDYIFFTGAPGSKWSAVSQKYRKDELVDNSDQTASTTYKHHKYSGHVGNYFGPGLPLGNWLNKELGTREDWIHTIRHTSQDASKPVKVILSHHFAYYLDELVQIFPKSKIVLCHRPDKDCFDWWHEAGGWDITYPSYRWYWNDAKMKEEIAIQNKYILEFIKKHKLTIEYNNELDVNIAVKPPFV